MMIQRKCSRSTLGLFKQNRRGAEHLAKPHDHWWSASKIIDFKNSFAFLCSIIRFKYVSVMAL